MAIVDTCVWSLGFRRRHPEPSPALDALRKLIRGQEALLIGSVRQEILSGLRELAQFARIREQLRLYPDIPAQMQDFERAGEFDCLCRRRGVTGSPTDMLICAMAERLECDILTTDRDFARYQSVLPVSLHPLG